MILAGDVGGTKVHLALFDFTDGNLKHARDKQFPAKEYAGLEEIVKEFMVSEKVTAACFGVPGPVRDGRLRLTNLPWTLDSRELARDLKIDHVFLINDLQANGYGIAELGPDQIYTLSEGDARQVGNRALISAGTGLGEAFLVWDGRDYVPYPSEGGHSDYAPRNEDEIDLLRFLRQKYNGRISFERVVSGQGLTNFYEFLREVRGMEEPAWLAERMAAGRSQRRDHRAGADGQERNLREGAGHVCLGLRRRGRQPGAQDSLGGRALCGRRHRAAHSGEAEGRHLHEGLHRQGPAEPVAGEYAGARDSGEPHGADRRGGLRRGARRRAERDFAARRQREVLAFETQRNAKGPAARLAFLFSTWLDSVSIAERIDDVDGGINLHGLSVKQIRSVRPL